MSDKKTKLNIRHSVKAIRIVTIAVMIVFAAVNVVIASFIGEGSKKGVIISSDYYFTSNILGRIDTVPDASRQKVICPVDTNGNGSIGVQVRNYDTTGQFDTFDVEYNIVYWLKEAYTADNPYTYTIEYKGNVLTLNSTAPQTIPGFTIPGNIKPSADTFNVKFNLKQGYEADLTKVIDVCMAAVPISPTYITSYLLGSAITMSDTTVRFDVSSEFDVPSTATFNNSDYAGFLYRIATTGALEGDQSASIKITWDAAKLEFDRENQYVNENYIAGTPVNDSEGNLVSRMDSITISSVETDSLYTMAFFRAVSSSDFWTENSNNNVLTVLNSLVTTETIIKQQ